MGKWDGDTPLPLFINEAMMKIKLYGCMIQDQIVVDSFSITWTEVLNKASQLHWDRWGKDDVKIVELLVDVENVHVIKAINKKRVEKLLKTKTKRRTLKRRKATVRL